MSKQFARFAHWTSDAMGSPWAFVLSLLAVVTWAVSGPIFHFSDTWQLVINTSTTVVTFWMVFLIQAAQNRNTAALHAKLDEMIRVDAKARNDLIGLEEREDA